jgi:hypothetical protein
MSDASRDSHTPAELVHEVSDLAPAVATEPALSIEVDGYQRSQSSLILEAWRLEPPPS